MTKVLRVVGRYSHKYVYTFLRGVYINYKQRVHSVMKFFFISGGILLLSSQVYTSLANTRRGTKFKNSLFKSTKKHTDVDLEKLYEDYLQEKELYKILANKRGGIVHEK